MRHSMSLQNMQIKIDEQYFTDYRADDLRNPTVKSCLIRILGSIYSKHVNREEEVEIRTIQKWDGIRPLLQPFLTRFKTWVTQKRIDEELKNSEKEC